MTATWRRRILGDAIDIASGHVDPCASPFAEMPHVGGENIESGTGRLIGVSTAAELGRTSVKYLFRSTDLLYSKIRPRLNKVATPSFDEICSADIYPIRTRSDLLTREFLAHLLRSEHFLDYTEKHSSRTNIPKINRETLLNYETMLPPIAEQRRIAEVLDRAAGLRAKRQSAVAQLEALTQAIFLDLFGDPVTNPKGLEKRQLGQLIRLKSGEFLSASQMSAVGAFPVFGGNGINGYHDEFLFQEPRILVGRVGMHCGCVHVSPPRSWVTDNALYVAERSSSCDFVYLAHALEMANLNQYASQSGQPLVSGSRIYPVQILVPPIAAQRNFTERAAIVEKINSAQRASLVELDALFASLRHRAFRGEL